MKNVLFCLFFILVIPESYSQTTSSVKEKIYFIVTAPIDIREKPNSASPVLDRANPLDYLAVQERLPNRWFRIKLRKPGITGLDVILDPDKATRDAYAKADTEDNYIVADDVDAVRIQKLAKMTWPNEIKNEAAKKRVQVGFSEEQVILTLGEPTERSGQTWVYSKPVVIMRSGKSVQVLEHRITFENGMVKNVDRKEGSR